MIIIESVSEVFVMTATKAGETNIPTTLRGTTKAVSVPLL
jgi:hypothetical protein